MKKLFRRGLALYILPCVILLLLAAVVTRYLNEGEVWVTSVYNRTVYRDGFIANGTVYDRNMQLLAAVKNGEISYSNDRVIRTSTVHIVGDRGYNIPTGALAVHHRQLVVYDPVRGANGSIAGEGQLRLSIDSGLNAAAYKALDGRNGAVAVCNYETGEMLCMVSAPSFDPALAASAADSAYLNRVMFGLYPPGSVFKLVTAAAAIETLPNIYSYEYKCEGKCLVGGNKITCVAKHGELTLETALANSCNCFFAQLSVELGAAGIGEYAEGFGLTSSLSLDGVESAAGYYDSQSYDSTKVAWSSVGQADDLVCPISVLRFVSAIARGGQAPGLTMLYGGSAEYEELISPDTASKLGVMMGLAAESVYGLENYPNLQLYAKSGTAEVGGGMSPHAWFVGYITNPDAPYAFVVIVENGGWGSSAGGRVANAVLQAAISAI